MRMGGGKPRLEYTLESLNAQRGTAYDTSETSTVYVENMAHARAIDAVWKQNERLSNQWDPVRMTTCLSRWEEILALPPDPTLSDHQRRLRVGKLLGRIGQNINHAKIEELLLAELGDVFVQVEYISPANAVIHVPDGTYPFGTVASDPVAYPWYSTVEHILILTQKPSGFTEGDYYEAVGKVSTLMDAVVPSWVTWDWYRASECGTPVNVPGGPSQGGFYLDCPHNLDNQVFDV